MRGGEDHRTVDSRGSAEARRRRRAHLIDKQGSDSTANGAFGLNVITVQHHFAPALAIGR